MTSPRVRIQEAVERFYADVWERRDRAAMEEVCDPYMLFRGSLGEDLRGLEPFVEYVDAVHAALEDYRCTIVDLVVEPPRAFARMRFAGTHTGELLGFAPTGKPVAWDGAALFTFVAGRIGELWVLGDVHGLRERLERNAE